MIFLKNAFLRCFTSFGKVLLCSLVYFSSGAQNLTGKVIDDLGMPLPYSSVYIKGTSKGTTANNEGSFFLDLEPGSYTIVCAHVGYQKAEQEMVITNQPKEISFVMKLQFTELKEVVIKANAADPAYEIIQNAIKTRKAHLDEVSEWKALVYMKGLVRTYQVPKKILGVKIDPNRDIIDSSGKGILYFSESLTRYSRRQPKDYKEEVISARVSGVSQAVGFNSPKDIEVNLYENILSLEGLNNRGFISPIASNALYFYNYHYLGSFFEDGREVNKIGIKAKRKFEPCFSSGYINIIEGSWRIHSADLYLTRESEMEVVDSVRIVQQLFPVQHGYWLPQHTNIEAQFTIFGIKAGANFSAVYSDYQVGKLPVNHFKGNIVKVIDTAANKKSFAYWDSIRPSPLTDEERLDYLKKAILENKLKDPQYLDSLDKRANRLRIMEIALTGTTQINRKRKLTFEFPPLIKDIQYNTVEGWLFDFSPTIRHWSDTGAFVLKPQFRYGFSSRHFNAAATVSKTFGNQFTKRWRVTAAGGKYIFQINPSEPIDPLVNTFATLLYKTNYMKIYEKAYGSIAAVHSFNNGLQMELHSSYEDRFPLKNTDTTFSWIKYDNRHFTNNYPEELPPGNFSRHQVFLTTLKLTWQPGQKFIQYPGRVVSIGSDLPVFSGSFTKAWKGIAGSDANFGSWRIGVKDKFNMRLGGLVHFNFSTGRFFNTANIQLPDWQHFNGNLTVIAREYTNSYQLAPYYANSTKDKFFTTANIEWHLNGLGTNKIPLVRRWNLGIVTGSNAFYVDDKRNYVEFFVGIENILKFIRIDFVSGYDGFNKRPKTGFVIGFSGVLTGQGVE